MIIVICNKLFSLALCRDVENQEIMMERAEKIRLTVSKKFFWFALFFVAGIFVASPVKFNFSAIWSYLPLFLSVFLSAIFLNFLLKNRFLVLAGFCLMFFFLGYFYLAYFESKTFFDWPYEKTTTVTASVAARPQKEANKQTLLLNVASLSVDGTRLPVGHRLLLAKVSLSKRLEYGDLIGLEGKVSKPMSSEEFDYQRYLKKYPVYGVINQSDNVNLASHPNSPGPVILRSLYSFSAALENSLNQTLPEPHASLAAGIILGQKRSLPPAFTDDLNKVGLSHIVAISGFNITIIFVLLGAVLSAYWRPRSVFWIGTLIALVLVLLTGMPASIVRAAIFSILLLYGRTIGRKASQANLMLLAAVVMLLANPFLLYYDLGFQLSFLAFIGLIYISPIFRHYLYQSKSGFLQTWLLTPLAETLGAQLAVAPLIMAMFGRLSLISPLSNILTLWAVELVMAFAFSTAFLGLISLWLAQFSAYLLWPLLEYIVRVVKTLGGFPYASFEVGKGAWIAEAFTYLVLMGLLKLFYSKKYVREILI